jgi:penicillin amidase
MVDVSLLPDSVAQVAGQAKRTPRWRRVLRLVAWSLVVVLVTVVSGVALFVTWTVRHSFPVTSGELVVPGLHAPVQVLRDQYGVPQLYADDPHDLFLAQGYTHAQDRFWEMDIRRHITSGRLSELFGTSAFDTDATVRTLGWRRVAEQEYAMLAPSTREYLQAYADGVNAYLADHHGSALSVEYAVLGLLVDGYQPEKWTPVDSVAWLKAMAWDLNSTITDQTRHAMLSASLPAAEVAKLFPDYDFSRWEPSISADWSKGSAPNAGGGVVPASAAIPAPDPGLPAPVASVITNVAESATSLDGVLGARGSGIGSNAWVVSGKLTASGKPLLSSDPHLGPQLPSVWYQMGLHCRSVSGACPFDVTGFTFSGMPGVIIGHDADVSWGLTNLGPADTDLYLERVFGDTYEYDGVRKPLETRKEVIKIANAAPRTITVRSTGHGPILSDAMDWLRTVGKDGREPGVPADGYAVAIKWTALQPGRTLDAVFGLDTAHDWTSFRKAASLFAAPAQNMVYADRAGHIGYQVPGMIPIRKQGDGRFPVAGWTSATEWSGYIPFDRLPSALDPADGYFVTSNNAVVDDTYPYLITKNWGDGNRSQRITDLIKHGGKLDVAAMERIQLDTRNANAANLVPYLLTTSVDADTARAVNLLRGWDFTQPVDSAPAAYFNAVWRNLLRLMFTDKLTNGAPKVDVDGGGQWFEVVRSLLTEPDDMFWHNGARGINGRDAMLRAAMRDADQELTGRLGADPTAWRWGDLHQLTVKNQTLGTGPAPLQWLLNRGPNPVAGGPATVDAAGWGADKGYQVNWVPSMRMVVDWSNIDGSRWVNLTGASGHAFDQHYDDQLPLWLAGKTTAWPFTLDAVASAAKDHLTLTGAGS